MKRKPKKSTVDAVISISGGRSSAMLLKILQDNGMLRPGVHVCFANTGKESSATLDFINECADRWGVNVVWLEFTTTKPFFRIVTYETADRSGQPFAELIKKRNYLPNPTQRFCTGDMKVKTIRRYIRSLGHKGSFDTYLGLRADEQPRVARKKAQNAKGKEPEFYRMPLYDMGVTIKERDAFWKSQPFDLAISSHSDNCDLCFMKGKNNLIWAIRQNPGAADWWIEMEKSVSKSAKRRRNAQFRKEYSYSDLLNFAENQTFMEMPDAPEMSITCHCTD